MAFDSGIASFTTKTDKVDLVQAAHMNSVQSELVTIETILGTNVKGDRADVKTRLNNALDSDGSLLSGSSFPSPALASQLFYRTDLDQVHARNAANSAWNLVGQTLSDVVFEWHGFEAPSANVVGFVVGTAQAATTLNFAYYWAKNTTYQRLINTKYYKLPGVSTLTFYARVRTSGGAETLTLQIDAGGQTGTATHSGNTNVTAISGTVTISSLTNNTLYNLQINMKSSSTTEVMELYDLIIRGS